MTFTDSWDAVDVHPNCYFDLDIFRTFPKGHKKLRFFDFRPWMGSTLCGPDLRICLPFTLDNDFYRHLRCHRCASNLLFWPWHFLDLSKRSQKTFIFQLNTLDGCHFVGTRSQKLFAIHLTQFTTPFTSPNPPSCTIVPLVLILTLHDISFWNMFLGLLVLETYINKAKEKYVCHLMTCFWVCNI